jgi:4-hydroxy-tetrahydrodipicolinate synthase
VILKAKGLYGGYSRKYRTALTGIAVKLTVLWHFFQAGLEVNMFKGSLVALVTPMQNNGALDKKALYELIEWHIAQKTDGLVIAGTTGEAPTLTKDEQAELISLVVKQVARRIPVIAGTGTNATHSTLANTKQAEALGVDACLLVTPYYNKPPQTGLYQHFKAVADNLSVPIILYNVPGRTACDLLPETIAKLAELPNIIGIKEATGKLERVSELAKLCGKDFGLYSGDDESACEFMLLGGHGVISVTANIAPLAMYDMCTAAIAGQREQAEKINSSLMLLHKNLFLEANPIPVKWALHYMGLINSGIRLPLLPLDAKFHPEVKKALNAAGISQPIKKL